MSKKLTQKIFNEEMFYSLYLANLTESTTVSPLLEYSLNELREQGYDVPSYVYDEFGDGEFYLRFNPLQIIKAALQLKS